MRAMRNVKKQSPLFLVTALSPIGRLGASENGTLGCHEVTTQQRCKRCASALLMAQSLKWWAAQTEDVA